MRTNASTFLNYTDNKDFNYSAISFYPESNKTLVSVFAEKKKNRVASFFNLKLLFTKPSEWSDRVLSGKVTIEYTAPIDRTNEKIVAYLKERGIDTKSLGVQTTPLYPSGSGSLSKLEPTRANSSSKSTESEVPSESESSSSSKASSESESSSSSATESTESSEEIKNS